MPVPTLITELSTTAASNYPAGTDSPATLDDVQRAHASFIAQIRDGTVAIAGTGLTGTASALSIGGNAATATNATNATNVTGTIASAATATTQTAGDNSAKVATTAYVETAVSSFPNTSVTGISKNLAASANGTSTTVSVSADEIVLKSATNTYITRHAFTASINSAATGKNGLSTAPTVPIATSTWYAVFAGFDGTSDCGWIDPSASAPTIPSGVTHYARVGWIRTDGTGNKYPLAFKQYGRKVRLIVAAGTNVTALPVLGSGTATWPAALGTANFVPPGVASATFSVYGFLAAASVSFGPSASNQLIQMTNSYSSGAAFAQLADVILESANVYWGCSGSAASGSVAAYGWEDNL